MAHIADQVVSPNLTDPETLARISRLEIRAKAVVEGMISGLHKSPHRGHSVEFAQHRNYTRGDEIRHIDWKVYARSDRMYVKQFEEETNLKAYLALDCSSSMDYRSGAMSKKQYGAVIAAALATLLMRQRDSIGVALYSNSVDRFLPAAGTPSHLREVFKLLEESKTHARTNLSNVFHDMAERIKRRSLIVIISDLFDDAQETLKALRHFRHNRHEVVLFHVMDRDELTFPFRDTVIFEGMEAEGNLPGDPNSLRQEYLRLMNEHVESLRKGCRENGMDYVAFCTDERPDVHLAQYLSSRSRT